MRLGLREEAQQRELRADRTREAMENVLVFLENVKAWMTLGDLHVKRACVRALGTNFLLSHKKLLWELQSLLERVQTDYKELEGKYRESNSMQRSLRAQNRRVWRRCFRFGAGNGNRTRVSTLGRSCSTIEPYPHVILEPFNNSRSPFSYLVMAILCKSPVKRYKLA